MAEESAGLLEHGHHAQLPVERRGCAGHLGVLDRRKARRSLAPSRAALASGAAPPTDCRKTGRTSVYGESFCASCHAVQNAAGLLVGGDVGPELTRVGSKVKPDWLRPVAAQSQVATIRKPPCRTTASTRRQLGLIAGFWRPRPTPISWPMCTGTGHPATDRARKAAGDEMGCAVCHEINGINKPENFAPDLTAVGRGRWRKSCLLPACRTNPAGLSRGEDHATAQLRTGAEDATIQSLDHAGGRPGDGAARPDRPRPHASGATARRRPSGQQL